MLTKLAVSRVQWSQGRGCGRHTRPCAEACVADAPVIILPVSPFRAASDTRASLGLTGGPYKRVSSIAQPTSCLCLELLECWGSTQLVTRPSVRYFKSILKIRVWILCLYIYVMFVYINHYFCVKLRGIGYNWTGIYNLDTSYSYNVNYYNKTILIKS